MRDRALFLTALLYLAFFVLFVIIIFTPLRDVFSPFIWSGALVYFFSPFISWARRKNIPPIFATLIVYSAVFCILIFLSAVAIPSLCTGIVKVWEIIEGCADKEMVGKIGNDLLVSSAGEFYGTLLSFAKNIATILVGATSAFYILADKNRLKNTSEFMPEKIRIPFMLLADDVKMSLDAFFKGQILIALILFLMVSSFLFFMGIDYSVGMGAIAAIFDIVPYVGAIFATALIMLVTVVTAPKKAIAVFLGILIIQQIENNVVTPKISSDTLKLHPSVTVLVLYLGAFGGFWGILLSVPLTCIFKQICKRLIEAIV